MATTASQTGKEENKKRVEIFDTEENLAIDLAKYTADLSDKFCKERGAFTVVVSGGSLIKSLRYVSIQSHELSDVMANQEHYFSIRLTYLVMLTCDGKGISGS